MHSQSSAWKDISQDTCDSDGVAAPSTNMQLPCTRKYCAQSEQRQPEKSILYGRILILCYATNAKLQAVVQVTEGAEDVTTVGFQLRKMASEWSVLCMGTLRVGVGRSTIHSFASGALMWRHAHV